MCETPSSVINEQRANNRGIVIGQKNRKKETCRVEPTSLSGFADAVYISFPFFGSLIRGFMCEKELGDILRLQTRRDFTGALAGLV